mgnify:CR=1 FL=1
MLPVTRLFSKDLYDKFHILTSRGIQERYLEAMKNMKRKSVISEYSLVSSEETMVTSEETQVTSGKTAQKKKKGNKIENSLSGEKEKFPPPEVLRKHCRSAMPNCPVTKVGWRQFR